MLLTSLSRIFIFGLLTYSRLSGELLFQEEFDNFNRNTWQHLITGWRGGNNEFQYYSDRPENSYVRDGILYIKPTLTADRFGENFLYNGTLDLWNEGCNVDWDGGCYIVAGEEIINPIQSARIRTINSFSFTYGAVEIRAKMPRGDWIWPAIWLLPTEDTYGGWPRSGEIDVVEVHGNDNYTCNGYTTGNQLMMSTLHWGPDPGNNAFQKTRWEKLLQDTDFAADFHIYGLEWNENGITYSVDGQQLGSVHPSSGGFWELGGFQGNNLWGNGTIMAPFDQKFHFILNVAVGGTFFGDDCINFPYSKPWTMWEPQQMMRFWEKKEEWFPTWNNQSEDNTLQVDYIRVYSLP